VPVAAQTWERNQNSIKRRVFWDGGLGDEDEDEDLL